MISELINLRKNAIFVSKIGWFAYCYKFAERGKPKFEHNLDADRDCKRTKFGGAQSSDRDFRDRKLAKSEQF